MLSFSIDLLLSMFVVGLKRPGLGGSLLFLSQRKLSGP